MFCIGVRSARLGAGVIFSTQLYLAAAGATPAYARRADHFQLCAGLRIQITHRCSLVMGNQVNRAVFVRLTQCYCWVRSSLRGTHPLLVFTMQPTNAA